MYTVGLHDPDFLEMSVENCLDTLKRHDILSFDSETSGLNYLSDHLKCIQIGTGEQEFVIHPDLLESFKDILESKLLIIHNASFDLKFLYRQDIFPNRVFDTMLAEAVLYCGDAYHKKALNFVAKKRIGIDLDKSFRKGIDKKDITGEYIQYAGDDVKYLHKIMEHQLAEAKQKDLVKCINLENEFVLVLAYLEYCGFKLDAEKWKAKMAEDQRKVLEARKSLDELIFSKDLTSYINYQVDAFNENLGTKINWDSSSQVLELFTGLGIDCATGKTKAKKAKKIKIVDYSNSLFGTTELPELKSNDERLDTLLQEFGISTKDSTVYEMSVAAKNIEKYSKQYPFIKDYLHYKELQKTATTYGQFFLDQISPVTGRIHTRFNQIMDTGRTSSGSGSKSEPKINFQNIPNNKETRSCFVSEEGNVLVDCDYSGQENIILCNKSMEPNLLEFYDKGFTDFHSFNAKKIFKELSELSLEEVKALHNDKRQQAKVVSFALAYGAAGSTIATNLDIPLEEGEALYTKYFEAYPGLKQYFKKCEDSALKNGYILVDNRNKRKLYIYNYERFKELNRTIDRDFWDAYKKMKKDNPEDRHFLVMKEKVKEYFQIKGNIQRLSMNAPIQGEAAGVSKIAGIFMFKWIKAQGLVGTVKIVNFIHDQYLIECPVSIAEIVKKALIKSMEDAGKLYYSRVLLKTSCIVSTYWQH